MANQWQNGKLIAKTCNQHLNMLIKYSLSFIPIEIYPNTTNGNKSEVCCRIPVKSLKKVLSDLFKVNHVPYCHDINLQSDTISHQQQNEHKPLCIQDLSEQRRLLSDKRCQALPAETNQVAAATAGSSVINGLVLQAGKSTSVLLY